MMDKTSSGTDSSPSDLFFSPGNSPQDVWRPTSGLSTNSDDFNLRAAQSLQNISNAPVLEPGSAAEYLKSASQHNISKKRKNKFDHVESKVKLYRLEIQNQQKLSKQKKGREICEIESLVNNNDSDNNNDDKSKVIEEQRNQIEEQRKQIVEQNSMIDMLNKQMYEKIQMIASRQIQIDSMRLEINTLMNSIENMGTPKAATRSLMHHNQFSIFRTPIRSISKTLMSPFRSASKTNLNIQDESEESDKEDSETEDAAAADKAMKTTTSLEIKTNNNYSSFTSDEPLMMHDDRLCEKKRGRLTKTVDVIWSCFRCVRAKNDNIQMENVLAKKSRCANKVYCDVAQGDTELSDVVPPVLITSPTNYF